MNNISDRINGPDKNVSEKPRPGEGECRLSTNELFKGARELIIEHSGDEYRLRITSKGKLILTK